MQPTSRALFRPLVNYDSFSVSLEQIRPVMTTLLTVLHVFVCLFLVGVVLLQSGKAGGMGVLSGGSTQTVFGGRGAGGFLTKATAVCATLFMMTSAALAYTSTSGRDALARENAATPTTARDAGADARADASATADAAPAAAPAAPAAPAPAPAH
jgi:preprotein translocase subunit SecG